MLSRFTSGALAKVSLALLLLTAISAVAGASTVVRFDTTLGEIDVRLYDSATPLSITNFLSYADTDRWDGTFIHRSVPGFIVQGGGFSLTPDIFNTTGVTTDPPVLNEPGISNLRGTIAYAKLGGDPDSATSQWFFNLDDNAANLDFQNGGFTVFGRVVGSGMTVVDSIAALPVVSAGGAFTDVPVTDIDTVIAQQNVFDTEAVLINDVSVLSLPEGDYNFDGTVDVADLAVWEGDLGSITEAAADGNGDGVVDGEDYLIWQQGIGATPLSGAQGVPEPSTLALFGLAILSFTSRTATRAKAPRQQL